MDRLLALLEPHFAQWGYVIVAAGTFLENATFIGAIIPGDIVLLAAGVYADRGALSLPRVMGIAFVGGVLGDIVGYVVGRVAGRWVADRFGRWLFLPKDRLVRVERYFQRNGAWAVLLARFAPLMRTIRTFVAGISKMPFWTFLAADIVGAAIWAVVVPLLGYLFSESLEVAQRTLGTVGLVVLVVVVVLFYMTYRTMAHRLQDEVSERSERQEL